MYMEISRQYFFFIFCEHHISAWVFRAVRKDCLFRWPGSVIQDSSRADKSAKAIIKIIENKNKKKQNTSPKALTC